MKVVVTEKVLSLDEAVASLDRSVHGAVITFSGTVRLYTDGRKVQYLDYEAFPEMAEEQLHVIAKEMKAREDIEDISIFHRTGRLYVGEASLLVAVASLHRRVGFDACLHTVERIKEIVPIWKKEVWEAGAEWVRSKGA